MTPPPPSDAAPRPPRRVFPIYAKILLVFFVNVLAVAAGVFWLLRNHFELDRELLLDKSSRERLQTLAANVYKEIQAADPEEWSVILQKYSAANHATLGFYSFDGRQLAGPTTELPDKVRRITEHPLPPPQGRRAAAPEGPEDDDPHVFLPGDGPPGPGHERSREIPSQVFMEAAQAKGSYWFVLRLPPLLGTGPPRNPPSLVGRADTLGQSDLFFNPKPWFFGALGILAVSALLWLPLIRSLTKNLSQVADASARIAQGQFDVRVNERRRDELGQLGAAINRMTERLAGFVSGQKRFLGDIAHELCSPLARMEMALSILEQKSPPALHERVTDVQEEVREMSALVSELLSFSKAGLSGVAAVLEPVEVAEVARHALEREAAGVEVHASIPPGTQVLAVPHLLGRALANLVRNAVRYAADRGPIEISARSAGDGVVISVADHGPGVAQEFLPRLFDPFFRADPSRTRETGGVGLGLAIVKSCAESCGGHVAAENRETGGLVVTLFLTAATAKAASAS